MRPIQTLPLPGNVLSKLLTGGFLFCEDVFEEDGKKIKLEARERLNNLPAEVVRKLESIQECPKTITALDLYNEEIKSEQIVTFSQSVDKLLDGGITLGEVTELSGASGSGKTQLCLQLCISVQIPTILGCVEGEAIYVDTNSGFSAPRLDEIAKASYSKCVNAIRIQKLDIHKLPVDHRSWLEGVQLMEVHTWEQLMATIYIINGILKSNSKVKLIVIDSLNFPFINMENTLTRTELVCRVVKQLQKIAEDFKVAVVLVNQLTTRIVKQEAILQPALGDYYGHILSKRFLLGCEANPQQTHSIAVYKSSSLPASFVEFMITGNGIEDVE
ncbi:DNA repair protein RAD51 homolog 3 [Nilaparvata lugens]|uniref:DNA repair protein RAD51 homolog 3 n=1 Tax=Nilaparvata lugens TaxID=108931 RepID=UPI00193E46A5|nr:DNA repair protein RAD51 homolog 3 [Nilaparvata lugens]XP_039289276.1 DNA repair protein RAD51 homolog 3 [Nilaparvata lugens]